MKKLIQSILLVASIILISGCTTNNLSVPTSKPKIDENLPTIDSTTIKMIPDMQSIALEWKGESIPQTKGYYIYRANLQVDGQKLTRVAHIDNKYVSHYLDDNLEPNTQYTYSISTKGVNGTESRASQSDVIQTKPRFESVSFLTAINQLPKQIKILWRPHSNQRVSKYIIEKSTIKTAKWRKIATVRQRLQVEYIDDNLKDNTEYSYRIKAVTFDGIESQPSAIVTAVTKPLPKPVSNISATMDLARQIRLSWIPLEDVSDIAFYQIYSSNNKITFFQTLAQAAPTDDTYIDTLNTDGKVRYYKIVTVDKDELESTRDVEPTLGQTLDAPAKPIITLAQIKGEEAILNWIPNDNRTVAYNIYKTTQENLFSGKEIAIKNITDVRFEDKDIVRGITYKYSIQSIDENGLTSKKTLPATLVMPKLDKIEK